MKYQESLSLQSTLFLVLTWWGDRRILYVSGQTKTGQKNSAKQAELAVLFGRSIMTSQFSAYFLKSLIKQTWQTFSNMRQTFLVFQHFENIKCYDSIFEFLSYFLSQENKTHLDQNTNFSQIAKKSFQDISVSLMRESLRKLRENKKHKTPVSVEGQIHCIHFTCRGKH